MLHTSGDDFARMGQMNMTGKYRRNGGIWISKHLAEPAGKVGIRLLAQQEIIRAVLAPLLFHGSDHRLRQNGDVDQQQDRFSLSA